MSSPPAFTAPRQRREQRCLSKGPVTVNIREHSPRSKPRGTINFVNFYRENANYRPEGRSLTTLPGLTSASSAAARSAWRKGLASWGKRSSSPLPA